MSVQLMQLTGLAHGFPIQDLVFGTSLKKSLQRQNLGLWDKIGTFLGPFFMKIWYYIAKLTQEEKGFKKHVVATLSAKSGLFEDHFRTFTGHLDYTLMYMEEHV